MSVGVPSDIYHLNPQMRITVQPGALYSPHGVVARDVTWCTTFKARRRGVLGREPLSPDEAFVIDRAPQVHTFGVPYALDVIFCDKDWNVMHVETLIPQRKSARVRGSQCCVEILGGRADACGIAPGITLSFGATP